MQPTLYRLSGRFKGILFILAILIIFVLLAYTQRIVKQLRQESREILLFYAQFYERAASEASGQELDFIFEQIIKRTNFPLITADSLGNPTAWKGIPVDPQDHSPEAVARVRKMMQAMGKEIKPIPLKYQDYNLGYLYYGDSKLITQLRWLPYIEIGVISLFILVGFFGFSSIKRSEQQYIWVGMAKETAHQLGTPLSSLMGWLELLKSGNSVGDLHKTATEMENDATRLHKVVSRFSQIGSKPDLKEQEVSPILQDVAKYFRRRLPQMGKEIKISEHYDAVAKVPLNRDLFEWVLENLIKNSLDAIEKPQGHIEIRLGPLDVQKKTFFIDLKDNGRGIEAKNKRDIFKPGYSTKKRGWGLGLNLAKRIVEEYHGGRLLLKETKPGEGTTMRIVLG